MIPHRVSRGRRWTTISWRGRWVCFGEAFLSFRRDNFRLFGNTTGSMRVPSERVREVQSRYLCELVRPGACGCFLTIISLADPCCHRTHTSPTCDHFLPPRKLSYDAALISAVHPFVDLHREARSLRPNFRASFCHGGM